MKENPSGTRALRGVALLGLSLALASGGAFAQQSEPSIYDRLWKGTKLYQNDENSVIQSLSLSGRFQLDYALVDADQGHHDEWNIRRFRFGAKAELYRNFTLHGEIELNPQEADPLYVRITDLYVQWRHGDPLQLTVGKHGAPFTMEGSTSSKELLTLDRSNLANNLWFPTEYFPGVSIEGERGALMYHGGLYSSGSANREFGNFDGSVFGLVVIGYDFAERWNVKESLVRVNYVHQEPDPDNTFTRTLGNVYSLNWKLDTKSWGLRADLSAGDGYLGASDLWGVMAMPFWNVREEWQLVFRYTYLESSDPNGVRLTGYGNRLVSGRGDEYEEFYFGLNYYLYGHKLKLQTGVDFTDMKDIAGDGGAYSGVAWTTGLRVSW